MRKLCLMLTLMAFCGLAVPGCEKKSETPTTDDVMKKGEDAKKKGEDAMKDMKKPDTQPK